MIDKIKIALCQMPVGMDKKTNLDTAVEYIKRASDMGAEMVLLPEMFICPYSNRYFRSFAEEEGGSAWQQLSDAAKECGVYLAAGTVPELSDDKVYNTCYVFDSTGRQIAKARKLHLFKIDVPGKKAFDESLTLSAGDSLCSFDSPWGPIGITICFDMRFPELYYKLAERGVRLVLSPADFALTSGQAHFELLCRQRATDAQLFTAVCSLSRDDGCIFEAWAHSMICSPWGEVLADAGIDSGIICKELDLSYTDEVRGILPVLRSRRPELYNSL